jgi:hypothetical protein
VISNHQITRSRDVQIHGSVRQDVEADPTDLT